MDDCPKCNPLLLVMDMLKRVPIVRTTRLTRQTEAKENPPTKTNNATKANRDPVHKCPDCKKRCKSAATLASHMRTSHKKYKCPSCPMKLSYQKLQVHLETDHKNSEHRLKGSDLSKYEVFTKIISGDTTSYGCRFCEIQFEHKTGILIHVYKSHHRLTTCSLCDKVFSNPKQLIAHRSQPHLNIICLLCNQVFSTKKSMQPHKLVHHRPTKCSFCPEMFLRKELRKHSLEHHEELMPTCGVCGLKGLTLGKIEQHQRMVHLKEKNATCDICNYKCFGQEQLSKHMVSHDINKGYECRFCKKKFARRSTRTLHEKIHTGVKDKVCRVCNAGFVQKASLNYHMLKDHPDLV